MKTIKLTPETKQNVLENLLQRSPGQYGQYEKVVQEIIESVKQRGDEALFRYTQEFDHCTVTADTVRVTAEETADAYRQVEPAFVEVMKRSAARIREFHEKQLPNSWFQTKSDGSLLGQRILPLERAGVYVPGGKAAYPSSVMMNIIPAKVAGVSRSIMLTPPNREGKVNPGTLVAADLSGADEIYKAGGAQAVAAMAFGTESIPRVDKITGPGNIYVALAKKACFGYVGIDSIAGPSEILVLADETADPRYIAADLLSQAEHDEMASAILITVSEELAKQTMQEIEKRLVHLSRAAIVRESLTRYGYILLARDMDEAIETANDIASEHVEILTRAPFEIMPRIRNAGAIFMGAYSSEPLGDYFAGPNHILPTNGTSRFFSPLGTEDFMKRTSIISYTREALENVHTDIELFAEKEGLTAHADSIRVRFEKES